MTPTRGCKGAVAHNGLDRYRINLQKRQVAIRRWAPQGMPTKRTQPRRVLGACVTAA
jgi:hypothetical protein